MGKITMGESRNLINWKFYTCTALEYAIEFCSLKR